MKVFYDHQIFSWQKYGGISRYFYEIMKNLPRSIEYINSTIFSQNEYIKDNKIIQHYAVPNLNIKGKKRGVIEINKISSIIKLRQRNYDIFHPTYFDPYFLKHLNKKPFVMTVHDMIYEKYPKLFPENDNTLLNKRQVIPCASKIIAVSNHTKEDLLYYFKIPPEKIEVIYHGFELKEESHEIISIKNLPEKFILFVGDRERYKNFSNFVHAVSQIIHKDKFLYLVCTGIPFHKEELILLNKLKIHNKTILFSASDSELRQLYRNALAFVFPSIYEGFGIPILEAFANNCPVVLSNSSSFPEVARGSGVYFDPMDVESIINAICIVIYDESLRKDLIAKGKERLKEFSWKTAAEKTANIYLSQ